MQGIAPRGHLVHPMSQRMVDMVSVIITMIITWWLSFKTLTFLSVELSNHYTEDLHHLLVVGGIHRTVYGCFFCVCVYMRICVCTGRDVEERYTDNRQVLIWFWVISYNRDHDANLTARESPLNLVPVFTSSVLIAGISEATPGKESVYTLLFSHVFCLKICFWLLSETGYRDRWVFGLVDHNSYP